MPQIYGNTPRSEAAPSIPTVASPASSSPLVLTEFTDSESDDSIVLSDLVRQGEASRLRRRGAMRLDHSHLTSHNFPAAPGIARSGISAGASNNATAATVTGGYPNRASSPTAASFVLVEREGWVGWEAQADANEGGGGGEGSSSQAYTLNSRRSRRFHRMTRRRYGPYSNVHGDAETERGDKDSEEYCYTLVCGAPDTRYDPGPVSPFKPSVLPLYPPSPSSSSSSKGLLNQDEPRTTGCGAILHLSAAPRPRLGMWAARSPATSSVVPLDASYFDTSEAAKFTRNACGCVKEGIGCAVCGNPLGIRYIPCKLASDNFFSSRQQNKHRSAQNSNSPASSAWRIRAPEGPVYWHSFPSSSSSSSLPRSSSPSSLSASTTNLSPHHTIYTIFSSSVTSHPPYTFPPPAPPPIRRSRFSYQIDTIDTDRDIIPFTRDVDSSSDSDSDADADGALTAPWITIPPTPPLPPVRVWLERMRTRAREGRMVSEIAAGAEGVERGGTMRAVEVSVDVALTTTTGDGAGNDDARQDDASTAMQREREREQGGEGEREREQEREFFPSGMILDRFAAVSPVPLSDTENEAEDSLRDDRGPFWHRAADLIHTTSSSGGGGGGGGMDVDTTTTPRPADANVDGDEVRSGLSSEAQTAPREDQVQAQAQAQSGWGWRTPEFVPRSLPEAIQVTDVSIPVIMPVIMDITVPMGSGSGSGSSSEGGGGDSPSGDAGRWEGGGGFWGDLDRSGSGGSGAGANDRRLRDAGAGLMSANAIGDRTRTLPGPGTGTRYRNWFSPDADVTVGVVGEWGDVDADGDAWSDQEWVGGDVDDSDKPADGAGESASAGARGGWGFER